MAPWLWHILGSSQLAELTALPSLALALRPATTPTHQRSAFKKNI